MITKLHIDTLVASKLAMYSSNEHFRHLDIQKMELFIRGEIESLCELSNIDICLKRHKHFNLKNIEPEDYQERIIQIDQEFFILAGIRFQGLDVKKPFVSVIGNFKEINNLLIYKIEKLVRNEFKKFNPLSFNYQVPEGLSLKSTDMTIDRYTVSGQINSILNHDLLKSTKKIELIPLREMNFYDEYTKEYAILYKKSPQLKSQIHVEDFDSLNDSAKNKLLFEIQVEGKRAGLIAGFIKNHYGKDELFILEEILFEAYRNKGLGVYIQKEFARKLLNQFESLNGNISHINCSSIKTALKNGRKITEIDYSFKINNYNITEAALDEMDQIYMMGFDVWGDDNNSAIYLNQCRNSSKYKKGKWYVLKEENEKETKLLSSLIVYKLNNDSIGIGSLATLSSARNRGLASKLLIEVIELLEKDKDTKNIFLYDDIGNNFYEHFGFSKLPSSLQFYPNTTCMIRGNLSDYLVKENKIPAYF